MNMTIDYFNKVKMTKTVEFKYEVGETVYYPCSEKYIILKGIIASRYRTLDKINCYSLEDVFQSYEECEISNDESDCFHLSIEYFEKKRDEIRRQLMRHVTTIS